MVNPFLLDVFIICMRESIEAAVVISVLLSFVKQSFGGPNMDRKVYKRLIWQIWIGSGVGILICLIIGGGFIGAFYSLDKDIWGSSEDLWEGILSVIATVMITIMGFGMLRINKMKAKWRVKIARAILEDAGELDHEKKNFVQKIKALNPLTFRFSKLGKWTRKYAMFLLPFVTTLREGIEAVVFVGGVGVGRPAASFPLSVILGLLAGFTFGYVLYKFGSVMSLRYFLIASTCLLYLIASGLFSRSVWYFEMNDFAKKTGGDVAESGAGPGSYDISKSVWHVNCCNPEMNDNGWGVFNALFGWQNSASYGSVISYNCYWIFIMVVICVMMYEEKTGHLPFLGRVWTRKQTSQQEADEMYARAQAITRSKINATDVDGEKDVSSASNSSVGQVEKKAATAEESRVVV